MKIMPYKKGIGMKEEKKIAILGSAPSTRNAAPFDDKSWEIWTINYLDVKRFDRHFQLHHYFETCSAYNETYLKKLKDHGEKVWLYGKNTNYPKANAFPWSDLVKKYGNYFTNSVAWLIAFAIEEGATNIGLWGIDMSTGSEWAYERPCTEYYLGMAKAKGIDVYIPDKSDLLKTTHLYGVENPPEWTIKVNEKIEYIKKQKAAAHDRYEKATADENFLNGWLDCLDYFKRNWKQGN